MPRLETIGGRSFLRHFTRLPKVDQEAIARHLNRSEQKQLADWLDQNTPHARRAQLRALKSQLDRNGKAMRGHVLRAVAQGKMTSAARASLTAYLSRRDSADTSSDTATTEWPERAPS